MITYNNNNFPSKLVEWENIAENNFNIFIDDDDIWEIARESRRIPIFENIYLGELLYQLSHSIENKYPGITTNVFINCIDTHLNIDGNAIHTEEYYNDVIEAWEAENN